MDFKAKRTTRYFFGTLPQARRKKGCKQSVEQNWKYFA